MHLRKGRNKIIKLFEDKYIKPTGFPYNVMNMNKNVNQNLKKLLQKEDYRN